MVDKYDPEEIMKHRSLREPIKKVNPKDFPRNEEIPDGCIVLEGLEDSWGYHLSVHTDVEYVQRKVAFGSHDEVMMPLHLIIFEPEGEPEDPLTGKPLKGWPCIVYIQGSAFHKQGLWINLAHHVRLAQKGYVIAVVEYRASEIAPFPAQMQDAKTAVRFMRKHAEKYHIDPEHMALAGDSSGGHTALMAGFTGDDGPDTEDYGEYSAKVSCIVDFYGPTIFSLMNYVDSAMDHIQPDSPEGFEIGYKNVLENPELVLAASPMSYLSEEKETPPLLIFHGGRDMLVNFDQSCQLYKYMKRLGKDVTFYKLKDANHGMLGFENDRIMGIVDQFLRERI